MTELEEIKEYLKVTWDDENDAIQGIINRSKDWINQLMGVELDYTLDNQAKSLLFDRVRYVYNNASEIFEENYQRELLRLQLKTGVDLLPEDDA
ncbi:head-tail connector protein [Orenia marismortui]|uniref:head-tail connector protein n=1 Tax=Orenia marismortui TaxID=46469 RepID=UPI00037A0CFF|nr:head-tail connector protein [Orenia marismortui]